MAPPDAIKVVLCDPCDIFRAGVHALLEQHEGIIVAGQVAEAERALSLIERVRPGVVVMALDPFAGGEREAVARLVGAGMAVLVLADADIEDVVTELLAAGVLGYLLKSVPGSRLVEAVRSVARGELVLPPSMTARMVSQLQARRLPPPALHVDVDRALTRRQRDVLGLVADGLPNSEVARRLNLSEATVKSHISAMLRRLGLRDRTQLAVVALRGDGDRERRNSA